MKHANDVMVAQNIIVAMHDSRTKYEYYPRFANFYSLYFIVDLFSSLEFSLSFETYRLATRNLLLILKLKKIEYEFFLSSQECNIL